MRDIVSSLTATALIQASNIGSGILLARVLQPDGRGELAAAMLWPTMIAAMGILGLHEAIPYHAARRRHAAADILRDGLRLGALLSLILLPIGAVIVDIVFAEKSSELRAVAFLYLAFIPLNYAGLFLVGVFQGRLRFAEWNLLRILVHVVYLLLIPSFYLLGLGGIWGFALASLLANAVMILVAVVLYRRGGAFGDADVRSAPTRPVWRDLATYGVSVHFGAAIAIIAERLDQMVISIVLTSAELGLFVVATTVSRLPLVLASTLGTVCFPKIASAANDLEKAEIFGRYARIMALSVLPASVALAAITPWLLPLFFGVSFAAATPVAWVLIAGAAPLSLKAMMSAGLKACDRGWVVGQAEMVTLVLSAASLGLLVGPYGLMGAAVASVVAQSGALVFMAIRTKQTLGITPGDLLMPRRSDLALIVGTCDELWRYVARQAGRGDKSA